MHISGARDINRRVPSLVSLVWLLIGAGVGAFAPFIIGFLQLGYWVILLILSCFPIIFFIYITRKRVADVNLLWGLMMLGTSLSFRRRDPRLLATSEVIDAQVLTQLAIYAMSAFFVFFREH